MAVRAFLLWAVVIGVVAGGAVAGARLITGSDSGGDSPGSQDPADPTPTPATNTPEWLANMYVARWRAGDFAGLYELLGAAARQSHPRDAFLAAHANFEEQLRDPRVAATIVSADEAGATLDVSVSTAYFGALEYTIQLLFTRDNGQIGVNWQPAAIHPQLAAGQEFLGTVELPRRGSVYDRNGELLAATLDIRFLGLNRSIIGDRSAVVAALLEFGFTQDAIDAAFASPLAANQRVPVGQVSDDQVDAAAALTDTVPGIILWFEEQRVHPLGAAAAHVIGYTREFTAEELDQRLGGGITIGDRTGADGLELALDEMLAGTPGATLAIVDSAGNAVTALFTREFVEGQDITTTLDANVLRASQDGLGDRAGASVVIDPRTNEILALNSSPSFDPDAFERRDAAAINAITQMPGQPFNNRATNGLYSAGSTFKLITGAAGLVHGGYTPSSTIYCGATWDGVDPPRSNWEGAQGPLTIAHGLRRSCNPVFYEIGLTLYNNTDGALSGMARAFGFGAPSGTVGLFDEAGLVPDAEWKSRTRGEAWFPGDEVNLAIGQGDLLITPLQLANAYSSFLAGDLRTPVLLAGGAATSRGALPLTAEQIAHLRSGLEMVTGPGGTAAGAFANAGYSNFGGKSGTAEDSGEQQHVLFVAYAPKAAPEAVAAVILDEGESGSIEVGPIARDLVLSALE